MYKLVFVVMSMISTSVFAEDILGEGRGDIVLGGGIFLIGIGLIGSL